MCLHVWKDIAGKYYAHGPEELVLREFAADRKLHVCSAVECFDMTAQDVDWKVSDKKLAATLKDHSAMAMMRDSLVKLCGDRKLEDFYWKGI
jgi:hypothetical protein